MRIIHFISGGDVGGAKTHVLSLLHGLMKQHTVQLVCFMEGAFAEEARELGIPTKIVKSGHLMQDCRELVRLIHEGEYQVLHCHGSRANMMGALIRRRIGIPVVTTVHSDYRLDYLGRPLHRLTFGTINTISLRFLNYYIGVSDVMANILLERNFDPQRIYAIYNGVDFSDLSAPMTRDAYLDSIGLQRQPDSVVFGIAARISPVKDMGTLVRAFAGVVTEEPSARLVIAGDGEQRQELEALAAELCPAGSVCFAGWVSDMASFYQAVDVNVLTSLSETFPYALTEGARMHCATIASSVGGIPILIDDGVNGLLFPAKDVAALNRQMLSLARNGELRRELAEKLFQKTKKYYSVEATVQRQVEIYESVLRRFARKHENKRDGVLICGAYGKGNAGDDAILEVIVQQMRRIDPDMPIYALSRHPKQTGIRYRIGSCYTFNVFHFQHLMHHTKLYISGGGTLIQNVTSSRSLLYYLNNIVCAHRAGNYVMMYGCGIGPVNGQFSRNLTAKTINCHVDLMTLRDSGSFQEAKNMGITRPDIRLTADPALLLKAMEPERAKTFLLHNGIEEGKRYVMFVPRQWDHFEQHIQDFVSAALYVWQNHGMIPVFFALEPEHDQAAVEKITAQVDCPKLCIRASENSGEILALMQRMEAVVSMRLHALVFAAGQGVPLAGIVYDPKVNGFLEYIGQNNYCMLEELTAKGLQEMIEKALHEQTICAQEVERLQDLALENERLARIALEA